MGTPEPEITETTWRGGERKWWRAETYATPALTVVTVQHQAGHPDEEKRGKYETAIVTQVEDGGRGPVDWSTPAFADAEDEAMRTHGALVEMALAYDAADE